jgi:hypothetical protein
LSGVVLEESHEARQTKKLSKGGLAKDLGVESDREDIADRLDELTMITLNKGARVGIMV